MFLFQTVHHAVNVLKLMFLRESKYQPTVIFLYIIYIAITGEMQSINETSIRVLDISIERIALKTFESRS